MYTNDMMGDLICDLDITESLRASLDVQVYGKPAPEVTLDEKKFLPPAPKDSDDEEAESW